MITSKKQYKEACRKLEMLGASLSSGKKPGVPPAIEKAGKAQITELMDNIKKEINEFDSCRNVDISELEIHSLDDLMLLPIKYRIASGMSIDKFAQFVGISPRQINRYEKEHYKNTHTSTLNTILEKLNVGIEGKISSVRKNKTAPKRGLSGNKYM